MKQPRSRAFIARRWIPDRSRSVVCVVMVLSVVALSACGASATEGQSRLEQSAVPAEATAEQTATATIDDVITVTNDAPVTAMMEKIGVTGEQYAAIGDPEAPITVVEFSDYGCPFCRRYTTSTYPELKKEYIDTGKVYYVFKDYPIKQLHPQAEVASQAAECAGAQGKYWEMHEALFANPGEWDTTEDTARAAMDRYATALELDSAKFSACMQPDSAARKDVEGNMDEGRHLGLTGTPSFVINGKLLAGAQPLDVFQRVFERELKSAGGGE